jgi:hypothetical protein
VPVVALVVSTLLLFAGIALVFAVGRRRPPGTPVTWGEAFVGGTFIFALMLLAYGVVPHQWLTFADNTLLWRPDKLMLGISGDGVKTGDAVSELGGTGRIIVNAQAVRDIVAATIYIVFLVAQVWLWSLWQKRGRKAPEEVALSSRFGRPVMRKV